LKDWTEKSAGCVSVRINTKISGEPAEHLRVEKARGTTVIFDF